MHTELLELIREKKQPKNNIKGVKNFLPPPPELTFPPLGMTLPSLKIHDLLNKHLLSGSYMPG